MYFFAYLSPINPNLHILLSHIKAHDVKNNNFAVVDNKSY